MCLPCSLAPPPRECAPRATLARRVGITTGQPCSVAAVLTAVQRAGPAAVSLSRVTTPGPVPLPQAALPLGPGCSCGGVGPLPCAALNCLVPHVWLAAPAARAPVVAVPVLGPGDDTPPGSPKQAPAPLSSPLSRQGAPSVSVPSRVHRAPGLCVRDTARSSTGCGAWSCVWHLKQMRAITHTHHTHTHALMQFPIACCRGDQRQRCRRRIQLSGRCCAWVPAGYPGLLHVPV